MRKRVCSLVLAALLACGACLSASAAESGLDLTGAQWLDSARGEKLAFLYGASSIVAIESMIAERAGREPSVFVQAWVKAFRDTSWPEIEGKLDAWYAAHPGQRDRHVLDVLWKEFLAPGKKTGQQAGTRAKPARK